MHPHGGTVLLLSVLLGCTPNEPDTAKPRLPVDTAPPAGPAALVFEGTPPKNLLFLSIDTLRKDHVGPWSDGNHTPFLDQLAEDGFVLDDHVQCANWTFASVTCTLAGRTNVERGHLPRLNGDQTNRLPVPPDDRFLSDWLSDAGVYTIGASNNAWFGPQWGNVSGYREFDPSPGAAGGVWESVSSTLEAAQGRGEADRWFVHAHFLEPHASYNPPEGYAVGISSLPPWEGEDLRDQKDHYRLRDSWGDLTLEERELLTLHLKGLYAGEVRWLDQLLAQFMNDAEQRGWLEDTLVVVWNDHGEQFWEHGQHTHAYSLHGEENDGFAIFWAENLVPGSWSGPTHSIDLVPTVLTALDLPVPAEVTGRTLGTAQQDRYRFTSALARNGGVQTVQQGGMRLHFSWRDGQLALYDRSVDPGETTDLFHPAHPEGLALWQVLRPVAETMATQVVGESPQPVWPLGQ
jgi:arylsulfatase A-like enzyme